MIYKNAKIGDKITDIAVKDRKIVSLEKTSDDGIDLGGNRIFPGLIDIDAHGCMGLETNSGEIEKLSCYEAAHGTTSWLPTTATVDFEITKTALDRDIKTIKGANVLGFHIEGPYISESRKGAQDRNTYENPI